MLPTLRPGSFPIGLLVQPALQITTIILLFTALLCPNPFTESGVDLLVVRPYNISSASTSSSAVTSIVSGSNQSTTPSNLSGSSSITSSASTNTSGTTKTLLSDQTTTQAASTTTPSTTTETSLHARQFLNLEVINNSSSSAVPAVSNQDLSSLELKYGPLGGCFRDASGTRTCTPASLAPSFTSLNALLSTVGQVSTRMSITGLPSAIRITPILLLTCFISLLVIFLLSLPQLLPRIFSVSGKFASYLSPDSIVQQHLVKLVGLALYARIGIASLLLGTSISLRLVATKTVYAFNAANASNTLPASLTLVDSDDIGMQAVVGNTFGLLWASVALTYLDSYLERRRIRTEAAVAQARKDIEGQYGRGVFEMLEESKCKGTASLKAESTCHGYTPSVKHARSVYNDSELSYTTRAVQSPVTILRAPSYKSAASVYRHQQAYPAVEKEVHYFNNVSVPQRKVYLHPTSSPQEWLDQSDREAMGFEHSSPFSGPGWTTETRPQQRRVGSSRSRSQPREQSRSRSRGVSPTPSYWTSNNDIDERTLRTLPSRVNCRTSLSLCSDVDSERDLPPRGPSALSNYSTSLKRKASLASQRMREHFSPVDRRLDSRSASRGRGGGGSSHRGGVDGEEEEEEEWEDSEVSLDEQGDRHVLERRRRQRQRERERGREELASLEKEILQRRRKELEWQMSRDRERAVMGENNREEGRIVGLRRLKYVKAAD